MGYTSSEVKDRYNAKHYKPWQVKLKFELFDELEAVRAEAGMSRSEFLAWALEQWKKQGQ